MTYKEMAGPPDFEGFIDKDVLDRFGHCNLFYGDIINAQLIKTNKQLIEQIKKASELFDFEIEI